MEIAVTIAVAVLLTAVMVLVSRAGGRKHQEDLSGHPSDRAGAGARADEQGRPAQPKSDRPAGPDAEAMGVSDAGATSVDPEGEHRGRPSS
jgi:hypothetical protein